MESLSSLHLLTEAVRGAGADIAPTYQEYIQLAFAIATDCGEVGRQDFLTLCSLSPKYDRRAADKLFSNALRNGRNNVHLGTAFHLAELCGVKLRSDVPSDTYTTFAQKDTASQKGAGAKVQPSPHTHTCTCKEEENSEMPGSDPRVSLPTFDGHSGWPYPLEEILKAGTSPAQRDVLLLGALTVLGPAWGATYAAPTEARWCLPACRPSSWRCRQQAKASSRWCGCWPNPSTTKYARPSLKA